MKKEFPNYNLKKRRVNGKIITLKETIGKSMSDKDKETIESFVDYCGMSACSHALDMIERKMYQIYDVMEKSLYNLELKDLREFLVILNNSSISVPTQNDIKKVLKRFLKFHYDDWSSRFKELIDIKKKREEIDRKINKNSLVTAEELELLIRTAEKLRYKALISLLSETGARTEEVRTAKWSSINLESKEMSLFSSKTSRGRTIPLNESIIHLKRYKQEFPFPNVSDNDFIFPTPRNRSKPVSSSGMSMYFKELGKKAGITKPIFPYLFRHTKLTQMYKTISNPLAKKFSGHSPNSNIGARYTHIDNDDMRDAVLSQVYHVEEISEEKKHELEIKMEDMEKRFEEKIRDIIKFNEKLHRRMKENPEVFEITEEGEILESIESQLGV
ncbi:tyrosine-type recombinase/integrase [Candidatus Pacearchaeota archaeon]|nr:tyrosine-type recombinase/integrase [Candidatus Pacearchaeota archaeon]